MYINSYDRAAVPSGYHLLKGQVFAGGCCNLDILAG